MSSARLTRAGDTGGATRKTHPPSLHETVTKAARGVADRTATTLAFDDVTRTFTITPVSGAWSYYIAGRRYIKSAAESIVIADTSGLHWIYYDGATLSDIVNPTHAQLKILIEDTVRIGFVYWNATDGAALMVADDAHGTGFPGAVQEWIHDHIGTVWDDGFDVSGYTLDSDADADVQFELSDGSIHDEDIHHDIVDGNPANQYEQQLLANAEVPILYRDDVDGSWTEDAATDLPYKRFGAGRLAWNEDDLDGTYSQTEVGDNKFVGAFLYATSDWQYPIRMIQGQHEHADRKTAVEEISNDILALGDLPNPEMVLLYAFTMQTKDTFGGTNKCKIVAITDLRRLAVGSGGLVPPAQAHAILSATHSDAVANAVTRGSLIYANATPEWDELVISAVPAYLRSDGTDPSWSELAIVDDPTPTFGGHCDTNDFHILNTGAEAYVSVEDALYVAETLGVLTTPVPNVGILVAETGTTVQYGMQFNIAYSGANANHGALLLYADHANAAPTTDQTAWGLFVQSTNQGVANAGDQIYCYGIYSRGVSTGAQDEATGDVYTYSGYFVAAQAGAGAHTAGNLYACTLYVEGAAAPGAGSTSDEQWAAIFDGPVQLNTGQKLILTGSDTIQGTEYIDAAFAGPMDFHISGTMRLSISGTRVTVDDELYTTGGLGILAAPLSYVGATLISSGSTRRYGQLISETYTGTNRNMWGLFIAAEHSRAAPTLNQDAYGIDCGVVNKGVADAGRDMSTYGGRFQANESGAQDSATGDSFVYSVYAQAANAGSGANAAGNFYGYSLFVEDANDPPGTPTTSQEWCALFEGPVQINSDQPLILEGSATSQGDTYVVFNSGNSHIEFWIDGVLEGWVDGAGFNNA